MFAAWLSRRQMADVLVRGLCGTSSCVNPACSRATFNRVPNCEPLITFVETEHGCRFRTLPFGNKWFQSTHSLTCSIVISRLQILDPVIIHSVDDAMFFI